MTWIREAGASTYYPPIIVELLFSKNLYNVQKELLGASENLFALVSEAKSDGSHVNHTMWHSDNISRISSLMLETIHHDRTFMQKFIKKYQEIEELHKENLQKDRLHDFRTIYHMMTQAAGLMFITQPHCVEKIEKKVLHDLNKFTLDTSATEILNLLTQPEELSTPTKEKLAFFEALIKFMTSGINDSEISKHFEKFYPCFLSESSENNNHINESWLKKKFLEQLTTKDASDLQRERAAILDTSKDLKKRKEAIIRQYCLPPRITTLCKALEQFAYYRLECHLIWMPWFLHMSVLVKDKAARLGIPKTIVENMRLEEFENIKSRQDLEKHPRRIHNKKIELFIIHINKDHNHSILYDDQAKRFLRDESIHLVPPGLKFLKGQTAFPGNVRGKVKLIIDHQPLDQQMAVMDDGDILVAWQTKPDMMPAIMKAAAIITNEGGIISHAAIVAREFKKPCVMMTRWATDWLKDGDLVEVDATNGIVQKVKDLNQKDFQ
ncbi:PEP-utilizing enzyme [Nanoarchaeota archaeon]